MDKIIVLGKLNSDHPGISASEAMSLLLFYSSNYQSVQQLTYWNTFSVNCFRNSLVNNMFELFLCCQLTQNTIKH